MDESRIDTALSIVAHDSALINSRGAKIQIYALYS